MSSIYKKGRDGYFYYQAYVYNSETKKKDKRIFHSLGTKKREEALIKQEKYDLEYEKKDEQSDNIGGYSYLSYNSKMVLKIIMAIGFILLMSHYFMDSFKNENLITENKELTEKKISKNIDTLHSLQAIIEVAKDISDVKKENNIIEPQNNESENDGTVSETPKNSIVSYKIERVEVLSGVFDQGKIYITTESESSDEQLRLLCNKIREGHGQFSNIIICIYSNDSNGLLMAKGLDIDLNNAEKKKAWLAMYSFNPVEGEYFDNNPSGYLDFY